MKEEKLQEPPNQSKQKALKNTWVFRALRMISRYCTLVKWAMRDSNPRLHPCKGCTLAN